MWGKILLLSMVQQDRKIVTIIETPYVRTSKEPSSIQNRHTNALSTETYRAKPFGQKFGQLNFQNPQTPPSPQ